MNDNNLDNIPLLDDLITKGDDSEQFSLESNLKPQTDSFSISPEDLEKKIHDILQRHTSQATAEILAIIDASSKSSD